MQPKSVRYYITQDADEPVVRSVPVGSGPVTGAVAQPVAEAAPAPASPERPTPTGNPVRKIVHAARREPSAKGR